MALINGPRVTRADIGSNKITQAEGFRRGTAAGDPTWGLERTTMARGRLRGKRGSKIVNSFVRDGHKGRHPGFATNTFPAKGARLKHIRSAKGY